MLFRNCNRGPSTRVTPNSGIPLFHRKGPEPPQLYAITSRHSLGDLIKNRVYDTLYVTLKKMRVFIRQFLDQFRSYHLDFLPKTAQRKDTSFSYFQSPAIPT
jgi:hypothetical protein